MENTVNGNQLIVLLNHLSGAGEVIKKQAVALGKWAESTSTPIVAIGGYNLEYDFKAKKGNAAFDEFTDDDVWTWIKPEKMLSTSWSNGAEGDQPKIMLDFNFVAGDARQWGTECRVIARVPDDAPWVMLAYALDVERWLAEDLVDGLMLSPLVRCVESVGRFPEYHIGLAHRYGKVCVGGVGSKGMIENGTLQNTGFFRPGPAYQLADRQFRAGADGMSLYQTETLVRMPYLQNVIRTFADPVETVGLCFNPTACLNGSL